jgi:hypothetical protein
MAFDEQDAPGGPAAMWTWTTDRNRRNRSPMGVRRPRPRGGSGLRPPGPTKGAQFAHPWVRERWVAFLGGCAQSSPEAPREPSRTFVDPALVLDEPAQRRVVPLVLGGVPHQARPLTAGPFVGLGRVSGAPDDCREGIFLSLHKQPLQPKRAPGSGNFLCLRSPPSHQSVHGVKVLIDCVAVTARLGLLPSVPDPLKVLTQGFPRVRDLVLWSGAT